MDPQTSGSTQGETDETVRRHSGHRYDACAGGPFATYQLGVLGADVIKIESPVEPDQARFQGTDRALSNDGMGTMFLTQASNKRTVTIDLKTEAGQEILKRLVRDADVFVENYRPGAFDAWGSATKHWRRSIPA